MTGSALASAIQSAMGFPDPLSAQLSGWGSGVVAEIQANALVAFASGNVVGICPSSGGALTAGAASGGVISGISGASMAPRVATAANYGSVDATLTTYCDQIASHIMTSGRVSFSSGSITGTCTNTSSNPGSLTTGAGSSGTISGLDGTTLANLISAAMGYGSTSSDLTNFCKGICDYIQGNAVVSLSSGNVTGTCPAGGGALLDGSASSGTIA